MKKYTKLPIEQFLGKFAGGDHKIGISIYPEKQDESELMDYIEFASSIGFTKIFVSLLQITNENKAFLLDKVIRILKQSSNLGFEIIADVNPEVLEVLEIVMPDYSILEDMGITTLRFDTPTKECYEAYFTNETNIKIEINISSLIKQAADLAKKGVNFDNVTGSHNFYPLRFTGLDWTYFRDTTLNFRGFGMRTSAFVTANKVVDSVGPWDVNDGLCTLERHRDIPIYDQVLELLETNLIEDVLIGNAPATFEELQDVAKALKDYKVKNTSFEVEGWEENSEIENEILFDYQEHIRRGDVTSYFVRAFFTRKVFGKESIPARKGKEWQEPGDIVIINDNMPRYKGEVHIVLKRMPNDGTINFVGKVKDINKADKLSSFEVFSFVKD